MFLSDPFPGAFGLDIGDRGIKLVQLSYHTPWFRPPFYRVKEVRGIRLPPGLIAGGVIQQPELARKKIIELLGGEGSRKTISSNWVVADLPEPQTFLKSIEIDKPAKALAYDDAAFHARKHLPADLDDSFLDWQILPGPSDDKATLLLATVPKRIADSYTYLLEGAGLNPLALEIEALSLARALITKNKSYEGEARAIIDLGAARSSLIVYDHGCVQFSTSMRFSGDALTAAVAEGLGITAAAAEKLKIDTGLRYDKKNGAYLKIVSGLVAELTDEIRRSLSFYREHFANAHPVTRVILAGGAALLDNVDNVISQELRIAAHPGNAWKNVLNRPTTAEEKDRGLILASAIGLAMRASQTPFHG